MSLKYTTVPSKRLAESITASASSFRLTDILHWTGSNLTAADFGTQCFAVFRDVNSTVMEIMEIDPATIASSSITITRRGLNFTGDLTTESSARKLTWVKGTTIVELGSPSPQLFQFLKEYIDGIAIAGSPDASDTTKGIIEMATQAETDAGTQSGGTGARLVVDPSRVRAKAYHDYAADAGGTDAYAITITPAITAYAAGQIFTFKANTANTGPATLNVSALGAKNIKKNYNEDLITGDIVANQIVTVIYDGTNMQVLSKLPTAPPVVKFFGKLFGDQTTQFDITNPAGTTFRYTYDGTGTDPGISSSTVAIGDKVNIWSDSFSTTANNLTNGTVTGVGANYFEVTNASGGAEANKTLSTGYLQIYTPTYTKPTGLRAINFRILSGAGGGANATGNGGGGGAGGLYAQGIIAASAIGATETVTIGDGGAGGAAGGANNGADGGSTSFGALVIAGGGKGGTGSGGIIGALTGSQITGVVISAQRGEASTGDTGPTPDFANSGKGGGSPFGDGGQARITATSGASGVMAGTSGRGHGGGGSGAIATSVAGGHGTPGLLIIEEYFS